MLHGEWSIVAHNRPIHKEYYIDGQRSALLVGMGLLLWCHPRLINFLLLESHKPTTPMSITLSIRLVSHE